MLFRVNSILWNCNIRTCNNSNCKWRQIMDYLTYVIVYAIKISIAILVLAIIYYYFICEVIKNNKKPELVKWNNKHVKKEIEKQMKKLEKRK